MTREVGGHDVHAFDDVVAQHVNALVESLVVIPKVFVSFFNVGFHALHALPRCFLEAPMHVS